MGPGSLTFAEVIQHKVNTHSAGHLAGERASHAVTNNVDAQLLVPAEIVLVVLSDTAHVSFARYLNGEVHVSSDRSPVGVYTMTAHGNPSSKQLGIITEGTMVIGRFKNSESHCVASRGIAGLMNSRDLVLPFWS